MLFRVPHNFKENHGRVHNLFAVFCKIDSNKIADARLHLSQTPIRMGGASYKHARLEYVMRHRSTSPVSGSGPEGPAQLDLPALIAARICHDLISPLGAIGNGVELLEMARTIAGPELKLVRDSVLQAQARIRLFRIAFGSVGSDQLIGADELRGILRDYTARSRFELDWTPTQSHPKPLAKLALLALLCTETALPYGGDVSIDLSDGALRVLARSDNSKFDEGLWTPLGDDSAWPDGLRAAHVQFPLLREEVLRHGATFAMTLTAEQVDMRITAAAPLNSAP